MPGRVVDAADVLRDGEPVVHVLSLERRRLVVRIDVAEEVPGGVDERVHRVDLAPPLAAAARARHTDPVRRGRERRGSLRLVVVDVRQEHRQLIVGNRNEPAVVAKDDRDRAAPVALPRPAPVAQAEADRRGAASVLAEPLDDRALRVGSGQPGEAVGVHEPFVLVDHRPDRQAERLRELEIAVVVRGDGHDRAGPVLHQDVVGYPDRNALAVDGVRREAACLDACLLSIDLRALVGAGRRGLADVGERLLLARRARDEPRDQRMLRRENEERRPEERVGPRRENGDVEVELVDAEQDLGALRAADEVALDRLRALGPAAPRREVVLEELVRVGGDLEEPLLQALRLDLRAAALAAPIDDLRVGQDGPVVRAPVDRRFLPVGEPGLEEAQEEPLRPAVEGRVVRRELAFPVDRPAELLHLRADRHDVPLDDVAGMPALGDRGVLGRQPERVVAHRTQDDPPVPAAEPGDDVAQRVVEDVAHVEDAGRIGQHLELVVVPDVRTGLRGRVEGPLVLPDALPLRLDRLRVVPFHLVLREQKSLSKERPVGTTADWPRWLPGLRKKLAVHFVAVYPGESVSETPKKEAPWPASPR